MMFGVYSNGKIQIFFFFGKKRKEDGAKLNRVRWLAGERRRKKKTGREREREREKVVIGQNPQLRYPASRPFLWIA